jgi:putative Mg2+ transporter-C (MgtC) family protein
MSTELTWKTIALRLALTVAAGVLVGVNRSERGHVAGLRTTLLVAVAASVAMLQVNLLLPLSGKAAGSFVTMDLMRLPLGVLSGMGFIGAGSILRRGSAIVGVTTAATMWVMTVIGLCFGGGQLALGATATAIAIITLWGMKYVDLAIPRDHQATLVVVAAGYEGLSERIQAALAPAKLDATYAGGTYDVAGRSEVHYVVRWRGAPMERQPSAVLTGLSEIPGIASVRWNVECRE